MRARVLLASLAAAASPGAAFAQEEHPADAPKPPAIEATSWSNDLVDPAGFTRFHLTTRATFSNGESVFTSASSWSYEGRAHVRLTEGIAISGVLPIGASVGTGGESSTAFLGNIALGLNMGGTLSDGPGTRIRAGGSFDVYAPTAPPSDELETELARSAVAAIRAYEPQLYVPRLLSFRLRGHADASAGILNADLELGLIPAVTIGEDQGFLMLISAAARMSAKLGPVVEPYVEVTGSTQLAGDGEIAPPVLLTPGLRLHLADSFDPAVFVSINFVESSAVVFGIDLAGAIRPTYASEREGRSGAEEFINF
jgi:hypothetical protein